eukprot:1208474-Rhodomonas_salina.1
MPVPASSHSFAGSSQQCLYPHYVLMSSRVYRLRAEPRQYQCLVFTDFELYCSTSAGGGVGGSAGRDLVPGTCLRTCYAVSGTAIAYTVTVACGTDIAYAAMRCPRMMLQGPPATHCRTPGELRYRPMCTLGNV